MSFDIKTVEFEGPESSRRNCFWMNCLAITVYLLLILPLPLAVATGAVSFVSPFDEAYYETHCQYYFSRGCPSHGHESWLRAKIITNCTSPDYPYHCILNTAGKVVHVCAVAQICPKGTYSIFDPRTYMVFCQNCQKGNFQPLQLWSNNTPVCKKKFSCETSLHQIECTVEPEKEHTQDTLCRCDAHNDYFLSPSENGEICVPGIYANCYKLKCPDGQERLLNYTCAPRCEEGFQRNDSDICIPKSTVITTTEGDEAMPTSTASTENVSIGSFSENNIIAAVVISVLVPIIVIIAIVLCWQRSKRSRQSSRGTITDGTEQSLMTNETNGNAASREERNQESCIRRLWNWLYNPVPGSANNANTIKAVSTNNAPNDVQDSGTLNNETNGNAASREERNQAQTDDVELGTVRNAPNDVQDSGTINNETNGNAASREERNQAQTDDVELGTVRNAPNDVQDSGTLNNETNGNVASREERNQEILHRRVLNRCLPELKWNLDFPTVITYIQQKEIFHDMTINNIKGLATPNEQISKLIDVLKQRPRVDYEEFKKCLVNSKQEYLKKMLEKVEEELTKEIGNTMNPALDISISSPGNSLDAV